MRRVLFVALAALLAAVWLPGSPIRAGAADEACAGCHEDVVKAFGGSSHGEMAAGDWFGQSQGCSSCHGPAEKHLEAADAASIRQFPGDDAKADSDLCLSCHLAVGHIHSWPANVHSQAGLSCLSCHQIHPGGKGSGKFRGAGVRPGKDLYDGCYKCHPEVRGQMRSPSRHPVMEGKMTCGSCHDPHGAAEGMLKTEMRKNDLCYSCHPAQQGPFVFQHMPVEEDCTTCHKPHGSVADNLLAQTEPFLCLQCHDAHFHAGLQGDPAPTRVIGGATRKNPFGEQGWKYAFLTRCTQCHRAVHGTDLPSQAISSGGTSMGR